MKDSNHNEDQQIREQTLMNEVPTNVETYPLSTILEEDDREAMEEAHYHHTINALVELMVVYGSDKVLNDLKTAIGWKKAW